MKKFKIASKLIAAAALALLVSLIAVSCDDKVTDLQPLDRITETAAFETPERCELSMVGVYDRAQSGFFAAGQVRGYPFGAANVQQGDNRGEDVLNVALFYAITYEATYNPTTANNLYHWETLYGLINRANIVIEGMKTAAANGILSAEQAAAYEGECRFLRALAHHELLVHFARPYAHTPDASHPGVPYRTTAVNTSGALEQASQLGRNTVKECYDRILEDLNFAESNLPETRTGSRKITRATSGAATALKTRIYLHIGDWQKVVDEGSKLVARGTYSLTAAPEGPFANNASNSESIFAIENSQADNPGVNGALPVMYAISPGRALVAISPISWNAPFWHPSDLRRTQLAKNNNRAYFTHKYRNITTQDDYNQIIRLAEVLLNMSEAYARLATPNTDQALALLNQVRNRALTDESLHYTPASFATTNDLIRAILNERRIEFLAEGRRWSDIHRLAKDPVFSTGGIPAKVLYNNTTFASWGPGVDYDMDGNYNPGVTMVQAIPYDDYRFVWPIPQSELNTNPVLAAQQNPGY